jgi:hypothetical protein
MPKRALAPSYYAAISTRGPYDEVDMNVIASLFLGAEEKEYEPCDRNLPHCFPKWEYPAIRDLPESSLSSGPSFIEYQDYVAILGDGDLLYIVPKERAYYERSRKCDWHALRIMNSLRNLPNRYLRLFGGGWTVVVDLKDQLLWGWHIEHGSAHLTRKGRLLYNGDGYRSLTRTRLTWRSQSEQYREAVYGEKVRNWKMGICVSEQ